MRKIFISILTLGLLGLAIYGGSRAFFSDTETSTGNTFTAGKIDLEIDHTKQTYNDVDCKTCLPYLGLNEDLYFKIRRHIYKENKESFAGFL